MDHISIYDKLTPEQKQAVKEYRAKNGYTGMNLERELKYHNSELVLPFAVALNLFNALYPNELFDVGKYFSIIKKQK